MKTEAPSARTVQGRARKSEHRRRAEQLLAGGASVQEVRAALQQEFSVSANVLNYCVHAAQGAVFPAMGPRKRGRESAAHAAALTPRAAVPAEGPPAEVAAAAAAAGDAVAACSDPGVAARMPAVGDRILVLKRQWLDLIISGQKTLEIRAWPMAAGIAWLGAKSVIHGVVKTGPAQRIGTTPEWQVLRTQHRIEGDELPYKSTRALPILFAQRLPEPVPYTHPRGAIGVVVYRGPLSMGLSPPELQH